ncbi:MAG: hypothetical protein LBM75_06320, partial [Myxococcales bacterium]|nr:hypothetical protein [Myxococcales bacterium]
NCVTSGCASDRFCPEQEISRIEFVAFIARMMELGGQTNCHDSNPMNQQGGSEPDPNDPTEQGDSGAPGPVDPDPTDPNLPGDAGTTPPADPNDPGDTDGGGDPSVPWPNENAPDPGNSGQVYGAPSASSCGMAGTSASGSAAIVFPLALIAAGVAMRRRQSGR